jgi:transposase-like protein
MSSPFALPAWYPRAFAHLSEQDYAVVVSLWHEEPALRELVLLLDSVNPGKRKSYCCPYCGNRNVSRTTLGNATQAWKCSACDMTFSSSTGTPFYWIAPANYHRVYAVAVVLWGPWTIYFAPAIAGLSEGKQLNRYRAKIQPLFDRIEEMPLVSHLRYRLGFSPAQQGAQCLRCKSDDLRFSKRSDPDNPCITCRQCGYSTFVHASRHHLLPLDEGVKCPDCSSRDLNKVNLRVTQRALYRCRNCGRNWLPDAKRQLKRVSVARLAKS